MTNWLGKSQQALISTTNGMKCYANTIGGIFHSVYSLLGNTAVDIRFLGFASARPASAVGGSVRGQISKVSSDSDRKMVGYSCGFECLGLPG